MGTGDELMWRGFKDFPKGNFQAQISFLKGPGYSIVNEFIKQLSDLQLYDSKAEKEGLIFKKEVEHGIMKTPVWNTLIETLNDYDKALKNHYGLLVKTIGEDAKIAQNVKSLIVKLNDALAYMNKIKSADSDIKWIRARSMEAKLKIKTFLDDYLQFFRNEESLFKAA